MAARLKIEPEATQNKPDSILIKEEEDASIWIDIERPSYLLCYLFFTIIGQTIQQEVVDLADWRLIEAIAEQHPYVVAILNIHMNAICTGTILGEEIVVTSGKCVTNKPNFIALGASVIDNHNNLVNNNSIMRISRAVLHGDYALNLILKEGEAEPNLDTLTSNIGLIFTVERILDMFHESAVIGSYYASELIDKQLAVVGFGSIQGSQNMALQKQWFQQTPCLNPKWYYCVCGLEYSAAYPTYTSDFGEGAPVLHGSEVVAVTALPCGTLSMPDTKIKYNVFTLIGPYLRWIKKQREIASQKYFMTSRDSKVNSGVDDDKQLSVRYVYMFLSVIKLLL